ncbi:auxin efflux carrier component 1-like [Hibiscus syriacus]|uniref:Auxin efflux carrier component 1-like n=1 Tax=Hibiscus syriacus TaxID=106335 RepID=A0A6A3C488_HIBSY|nr:protein C2-DOMAIN ABA-RELATED 4-like [Hibiscus syriacus]XP_039060579.1 protein C2-DOMAIN ABA-RELATED 4-like [Hibiscus syriacus]KAE8723985.1 auxin efflux carrier component 1-like [Hibiscus syriacus]
MAALGEIMGLLRIHVKRGVNLAVRDVRTSDPYIIFTMGNQTLKTRVIDMDVNPVWNEDLTLSITDPDMPIHLIVYDYDRFSMDDKMGDAEFSIKTFIQALRLDYADFPNGTILSKVQPCRTNCLAEESSIVLREGKVVQDLCLRLRNVECGEIELQLEWIDLPGCKGLR